MWMRDFLAPAFGIVHGRCGPRGIVLDFETYIFLLPNDFLRLISTYITTTFTRLAHVNRVTETNNVLIALHGVIGCPDALLQQFIAAGMRNINVNEDILSGYYAHLEQKVNEIPFTKVVDEAVEKVAEALAKQMDAIGSSGKA